MSVNAKSKLNKKVDEAVLECLESQKKGSSLQNLVVSLVIVWVGAFLFLFIFYNFVLQFLVDKFIN